MIALAVVAAGLLIAAAVLVATSERVLRGRHRRKVIITCKDGGSWRGVLWQSDRRMVVLRNTDRLSSSDGSVAVDGEVLLHRADIEFLQRF